MEHRIILPIGNYLKDHHLMGRPVLPAVEALQALARVIAESGRPDLVRYAARARFLRFLYLPEETAQMEVIVQVTEEAGGLQASLLTEAVSKSGSMSRRKEHITAWFGSEPALDLPPMDVAAVPEGPALIMTADRLYQDLVPFGPCFHNVIGRVHLSRGGVMAEVQAPDLASLDGPLGSPFPIDAAFHLACAWGQRFEGLVGFPVAFEERLIYRPMSPGERAWARVMPRGGDAGACIFDTWLFDDQGRALEAVLGLTMKDTSGGRMTPPAGFQDPFGPALADLEKETLGLAVVEMESPAPFASKALSDAEARRAKRFGAKRYKEFLAARLAVKQLSRKLGLANPDTPARDLETLADDPAKPRLPQPENHPPVFVSVSHSGRFAAAAASEGAIGLDIEHGAEKAVKGRTMFMNEREWDIVDHCEDGAESGALRVWTIKEAVSKALDQPLPETWSAAEVVAVGSRESLVQWGDRVQSAFHAELEDHLMTLVLA